MEEKRRENYEGGVNKELPCPPWMHPIYQQFHMLISLEAPFGDFL